MLIRALREGEMPVLEQIERAAGEAFREYGMAAIADDEPFSLEELDAYRRAGRAWVAVEAAQSRLSSSVAGDDVVAGYLVADVIDGNLHVEQVSVRPRAARRGVGRALIEHLASLGRAEKVPALTLTTFADVPWNAPYYERCGFVALADDELTPGLRAVRRREAAHGLDRWPRLCMRRPL
jgi:GNAT superfamily N-acetyltransferase